VKVSEEEVFKAIREFASKYYRGPSVSELHGYLLSKGVYISERGLRYIIKRLVSSGKVREVKGRPLRYEPVKGTFIPLTELVKSMRTSEEVSGEVELKESDYTQRVAQFLIDYLNKQPKILDLIERNADKLAQANPIEAALELIDWVCREVTTAASQGRSNLAVMVRTAERLIKRYYASVLGVPVKFTVRDNAISSVSADKLCGSADSGILGRVAAIVFAVRRNPKAASGFQVIIGYNRKRLERYLMQRFLSDRLVVSVRTVDPGEINYVSGHDTSYWSIELNPFLLSQFHGIPVSTEMYLLAGIRYLTWRAQKGDKVIQVREVVPHPRNLPSLKHPEAVNRGYLITPQMIEDSEERVSRLVEAAMNILEYGMILDDIEGRSSGALLDEDLAEDEFFSRPLGAPRPILHDGRILPYEHKLGDYAGGYGGWHSRLVRQSMNLFAGLIRAVIGDDRLLICGVVKRAHSPYLHPLLIWLLKKIGLISEDEFWENITRWVYERFEVSRLFCGLSKRGVQKGVTYATVPVVRRLWAMDDQIMYALTRTPEADMYAEYSEDFWLNKALFDADQISGEIEPGLRGYLSKYEAGEREARLLAYVLANASVALTYVMPPYVNFCSNPKMGLLGVVIPRYEILIRPLSFFRTSSQSASEKQSRYDINEFRKYVISLVQGLAIPKIPERTSGSRYLFKYEVAGINENISRGRPSSVYMVLPHHICEADRLVRRYDEELKNMYVSELIRAISRILRSESTMSSTS